MSDINEAILEGLKKINTYLEKLDWKMWNIHQKYLGAAAPTAEPTEAAKPVAKAETVPAATVAAAAEVPKFVPKVVTAATDLEDPPVVVIPEIPKYPSIEKA